MGTSTADKERTSAESQIGEDHIQDEHRGSHEREMDEYHGIPSKRKDQRPDESRPTKKGAAEQNARGGDLTVKSEGEQASDATATTAEADYSGPPLPHDAAARGSGARAYLAHAAPHLFRPGEDVSMSAASPSPSAESSRSPSPSSSSRASSPAGASTAHGTSSAKHASGKGHSSAARAQNVSTKHRLPPNFRGPIPQDKDADDVAPRPSLHAVPGSETFVQPHNTPLNRNSWRYTFAGPDTIHMPTSVYRSIPATPTCVRWDWSDRSGFTKMTRDADVASSDRGWRSIRSNIPVREGSWYCEIEVLPPEDPAAAKVMKDGPHVRLGWARREAPLNAPVGFDGYSYGLRDTSGERVLLSRPQEYGSPFKPGDVVGMYIHLPPLSKPNSKDLRDPRHVRRRRIPIRYRGQTYFEQLEYAPSKEMEHLMERSWAGEQLLRSDGSLKLVRGEGGLDADSIEEAPAKGAKGKSASKPLAPSHPTAPPGTGKSKRQAGPPSGKSAVKTPKKQLRPLPTLGESSRIGFFLNGQPQGWAFRDLLDFRPLRQATQNASKKKANGGHGGTGTDHARPLGHNGLPLDAEAQEAMAAVGLGLDDTPLLTTSASLAAIMKSRENPFDDGSTGYFAFVSLYGGARARIRTKREELKFPPAMERVEEMLQEADRRRGTNVDVEMDGDDLGQNDKGWWGQTRPLNERYEGYWSEQWTFDIEEEERARVRAKFIRPPQNDDEDDANEREGEEAGETGADRSAGLGDGSDNKAVVESSKGKKGSSSAAKGQGSRRGSSTPRTPNNAARSPSSTPAAVSSPHHLTQQQQPQQQSHLHSNTQGPNKGSGLAQQYGLSDADSDVEMGQGEGSRGEGPENESDGEHPQHEDSMLDLPMPAAHLSSVPMDLPMPFGAPRGEGGGLGADDGGAVELNDDDSGDDHDEGDDDEQRADEAEDDEGGEADRLDSLADLALQGR